MIHEVNDRHDQERRCMRKICSSIRHKACIWLSIMASDGLFSSCDTEHNQNKMIYGRSRPRLALHLAILA